MARKGGSRHGRLRFVRPRYPERTATASPRPPYHWVVTFTARSRPTPPTGLLWLPFFVAALGFVFNQFQILAAPLVLRPVLQTLGGLQPGSSGFNTWSGILIFVPAAVGGLFGLGGGYLSDLLGRRRLLVMAIVTYGVASLGAALSTSVMMFLLMRCVAWAGVCVEFVAAIAWVAELYPDPTRREHVLGYSQSFIGLGGLLVSGVYYLAATWAHHLPELGGGHEAWRYTLLVGTVPAVAILLLRPFMPESPVWLNRRASGPLARPPVGDLFSSGLLRTTMVSTLLVACAYALPYGATQHTPRIVPGLPSLRGAPSLVVEQTVSLVQMAQEVGGFLGRVLLSIVVVSAVTRRRLLTMFLIPTVCATAWLYFGSGASGLLSMMLGVALLSLLFNAQMSFWGNYLPRVFPTRIRATGEGFAMNIGGRILGTSAAMMTTQLATVMPGTSAPLQLAYAAGAVALTACAGSLALSPLLREPDGLELPA